jgi:hypothetical protein
MFANVLHRNRTTAPATGERLVEERDADGRVVTERVADTPSGRPVVEERTVTEPVTADRTVTEPATADRTVTEPVADRTVVDRTVERRPEPVTEPDTEAVVEERPRWPHSSVSAVVGLVVGVVALGATLTGLLAPVGVALGVLGGLISLTGLVRASRRGVTGHGAAFVGVACSAAAVVLGVLAIQGDLSWLNSDTDEVAKLHTWLNNHVSGIKRW